jgi:hypothetical protein
MQPTKRFEAYEDEDDDNDDIGVFYGGDENIDDNDDNGAYGDDEDAVSPKSSIKKGSNMSSFGGKNANENIKQIRTRQNSKLQKFINF